MVWDKVAVIFGLFFGIFAILPNLPLFRSICISLLRLLPIHANQCTQLMWDDIAKGLLHDCSSPLSYACKHKIDHVSGKVKCWDDLFSVVFSKAWKNEDRKARRVPKPQVLALFEEFVQIDFTVFMAFLISTVGCNEDLGSLIWGFSTYTSSGNFVLDAGGAQRLHLKDYDQCLVLHLFAESCRPWTPDGDRSISSWTKDEIENLIDGYPPFYSAEVHLKGMITESPIHSVDDIKKGGWVLAVRLGRASRPLPFYFESQSQYATNDPLRKPTFQLATEWVRDLVAEPFTKTFHGNSNVDAALRALNRLCRGQENISCALEKSDLNDHVADTLTADEAINAMNIFNRPTLMTQSEREDLRRDAEPILVPLLSAAVFGVKEVIRFEKKCINLKEKLPPILTPSAQIYVRDCTKTGFDASRRYPRIDIRQKKD
jgi:hypothetical protein